MLKDSYCLPASQLLFVAGLLAENTHAVMHAHSFSSLVIFMVLCAFLRFTEQVNTAAPPLL